MKAEEVSHSGSNHYSSALLICAGVNLLSYIVRLLLSLSPTPVARYTLLSWRKVPSRSVLVSACVGQQFCRAER